MFNLSAAIAFDRPVFFHDLDGNAHWWFSALDQRWFSVGADRWLTQVVGIHEDGGDIWIQLQTLGEQLRDFTIRVLPGMSLPDVVKTIESQISTGIAAARLD